MSQRALDTLIHATRRAVDSLAVQAAAGSVTPEQFGDRMADLLEGAHARAVVIGRNHAGDTAPEEDDDRRFGAAVVDGEAEFLAGFVSDLQGDRYRQEGGDLSAGAIQARASLYADRVSGTANEVWGLFQEPGDTLVWNLGAGEPHCTTCPELAAGGPYTPETIPTWPRMGGTECLSRCTCTVTVAGREGFRATARS